MNENTVMVSVVMPVYNHSPFLKEAIESVIFQKVNFSYELLVGEDCSKDNSLEIIRKYEKEYPEIIRVFARKTNMGAIQNGYDLRMHAKGKYLIQLEGDDYWTDDLKLQKQVDFLEKHSEYIACAHRFHVVDRDGTVYHDEDFECQFFQNNPYTKEIFESGLMLSHHNSILYHNIFSGDEIDTDFWTKFHHMTADYTIHALLVLNGKMYCLPDYMLAYRKNTDKSSSSFSAKQEYNNTRDVMYLGVMELEEILNKHYSISLAARKKNIFASAVFKWYRDKNKKNFKVVINIIKMSKRRFIYTYWFLMLIVKRSLLNITGHKKDRVKF